MGGFLLALEFTPRITRLAVEVLSRAFAALPDEVLVPWLPKLVVTLRPLGGLMQTLVKEAGLAFPRGLAGLPSWQFAWERALPPAPAPTATDEAVTRAGTATVTRAALAELSERERGLLALLKAHPASLDALVQRLGGAAVWPSEEGTAAIRGESTVDEAAESAGASAAAATPIGAILQQYPATLVALVARLSGE